MNQAYCEYIISQPKLSGGIGDGGVPFGHRRAVGTERLSVETLPKMSRDG